MKFKKRVNVQFSILHFEFFFFNLCTEHDSRTFFIKDLKARISIFRVIRKKIVYGWPHTSTRGLHPHTSVFAKSNLQKPKMKISLDEKIKRSRKIIFAHFSEYCASFETEERFCPIFFSLLTTIIRILFATRKI